MRRTHGVDTIPGNSDTENEDMETIEIVEM